MADFAQGLLKFAAADPEKATTQQLAEAFSDLPEKAKEATIQKRALELAESGLEADQAIALADRERGVVELNIKLREVLNNYGLDAKDMDMVLQLTQMQGPELDAALAAANPRVAQAVRSIRAAKPLKDGPNRTRSEVAMTAASKGTKQ